jgi:uncharacterized protein (TIGR02391 family)
MQELINAIPDAEILLALEPEELGAKLLFILRGRRETQFHPGTLKSDVIRVSENIGAYRNKQDEVSLALSEAFGWLQAQGLIVDAPDPLNATHGWRVLSRRARAFEDERQFANYAAARHLPKKETLHPRIAGPAWSAFMRGEYDVAAFQAMKAVEVHVREAAELEASDIGPDLMRKAFNVDSGRLTDKLSLKAERHARSNLFAGAIGCYKNPGSHRDVDLDDPVEAAEIVLLANHLLRIVDVRRKAIDENATATTPSLCD